MSLHWAVLLLAAVSAFVFAYWWVRFTVVLPLEERLSAAGRSSQEFGSFARELLDAHRLAGTPQSFTDSVQYAVERFQSRCPDASVLVWMRRRQIGAFAAVEGELVCRTGVLASLEAADLALHDGMWDASIRSGEEAPWPGGWNPGFVKLFGSGRPAARFIRWGSEKGVWGVLGVLGPAGSAGPESCGRVASDILATYLGTLAERCAQFWELNRAREQLEGGLSVTMARLDETNLQLIQRAKEMKTLEEITEAISERPDQAEVLSSIVSIVATSLEADVCAFLLLDEKTGELVTQPGAFGISHDEGALYRISLQNDEASSVRVFMTGKPFMTGDAQSDPQVIAQFARLWKCHSLLVIPLSVEGRRIGVMRVGSFKRDYFTPDHLKFVRVIAEEAAVLVESAVLAEKLAATNLELAKLHSLKDEFVSTVSHEFKTPLTSIKGFLAVLLEQEVGPLNAEQKRFLKIVLGAADRLGHLVSDMLDMSRLEGGLDFELAAVNLEQVARTSVENQRYVADNKGIRIVLEVPPLLPPAKGSEEWLRHVFDNLISNALKFTPERGQVTVGLANKGDCLMATVSDSGIGIPDEDKDRIFEKFYRAGNRHAIKASGTGLGLAICKSIMDKHEGRIWFESELDKGTRFFFVLPIAEQSAQGAARGVEADLKSV